MDKNLLTDLSRRISSARIASRHFFDLIIGILALVFAQGVGAESITLQWDPVVDDTLVTGYEVHYGVESGQYQWVIDADTDGAATNTQLVENLVAGNTYYFAVRSHNHDDSLVSAFSNEISATIASSDTIPPMVSISTTPEGPTYTDAQTVTISADASDNVGVTRVEFYDGTTLKSTDTLVPYSYSWAISSADNGLHYWTAKAYDAAGNVSTSDVLIRTVSILLPDTMPPTVSISTTPEGPIYTTAQTVTVGANASDNVGVARVEFYDGTTLKGTDTLAPYSYSWAISSADNGTHNWTAKAYDAAGNVSTSGVLSRTVSIVLVDTDTTPPAVSISSTPEGPIYTSAQTVTISAAASDNVGVTRVEFYDGTTLKGTDTTEPYSYTWYIKRIDNGIHNWTAKAYDAAENTSTTGIMSRIVNITSGGRVATYDFDEVEGIVVMDTSGNDNDGLITDATRTTDGRFGSAVSFDGADDRIDLNTLDITGGEGLTISAWMKADDFGTYDARLVSKAAGVEKNDHYWMVSTFSKNRVLFRLKTGGSTTSLVSNSEVIAVGQWHHVTATYDGQLMRLYVDGVEVGAKAKSGAIDTNASVPVAIGNQPQGDRPFDGLIDEVRLYNRALIADEINADMVLPIDDSNSLVPKVEFSANRTSGVTPLTVVFTDQSAHLNSTLGDITGRLWDFGDGGSSNGQTAAYTYTKEGTYTVSLTVTGLGGTLVETKTNYISVSVPPVANFSASALSGTAPLTVNFSDMSVGAINDWTWDFGDGAGSSTAQNPQHIYTEPGIYSISLTASGPGGTDSELKLGYISVSVASDSGGGGDVSDSSQYPQLEVGEAEVDYRWKRIEFEEIFGEPPVVIANSLSAHDDTPATVRIRNIDSSGFEIRVQEWDYLNDTHGYETVSYLVMESGNWELNDGTRIEAKRFETDATRYWESVVFEQNFDVVPVVLAAVTTQNGSDAVITRLREIDADQFQVRMYEQEANRRYHVVETISYIVWEPSSGTVGGVPFEVGMTPDEVSHKPFSISYQTSFAAPPVFLAHMQTTDGGDTSNVRWWDNTKFGVDVWIQEEQSKDSEVGHTTESIGYMSFGQW